MGGRARSSRSWSGTPRRDALGGTLHGEIRPRLLFQGDRTAHAALLNILPRTQFERAADGKPCCIRGCRACH